MTKASQYALVQMGDGGLLLDLESGGLFQLNATAAFVWRQLLDGVSAEAISSTIAARHGIDAARARADVAAVLAPTVRPQPGVAQDYEFRRTTAGYVHLYRERPELELDASGDQLTLVLTAARRPWHLRNSVRAVLPKILSLRGHTVLHASAVLAEGRLLAFSGRSGAGKTTTARALVDRGATLVSEDKLLVRADERGCVAWRDAEPHMDAWVLQASLSLLADGRAACGPLDEAARGEELPIAELGFLDELEPRRGDAMVSRLMGTVDGAAAAFRAMFLGTELADAWRRQIASAASLAEHVSTYALTMPEGLGALGRAAEVVARRGTLAA